MSFAIIAAVDRVRGIGKQGGLSWRLPSDLKHFAEITKGVSDPVRQNAVIMGRKTWESLPEKIRPLPGRLNVVVTSATSYKLQATGLVVVSSLDEALKEVVRPEHHVERAFVMGGGQLYAAAIQHPACERLYLTEVEGEFGCDVFFPEIPEKFVKEKTGEWQEENGIRYRFVEYERSLK